MRKISRTPSPCPPKQSAPALPAPDALQLRGRALSVAGWASVKGEKSEEKHRLCMRLLRERQRESERERPKSIGVPSTGPSTGASTGNNTPEAVVERWSREEGVAMAKVPLDAPEERNRDVWLTNASGRSQWEQGTVEIMGSHGEVYALRPSGERHTVWGIFQDDLDSTLQATSQGPVEEDYSRDAPQAAMDLRAPAAVASRSYVEEETAAIATPARPMYVLKTAEDFQVAQTPVGLVPTAADASPPRPKISEDFQVAQTPVGLIAGGPSLVRDRSRVAASPGRPRPRAQSTPKTSSPSSPTRAEPSIFQWQGPLCSEKRQSQVNSTPQLRRDLKQASPPSPTRSAQKEFPQPKSPTAQRPGRSGADAHSAESLQTNKSNEVAAPPTSKNSMPSNAERAVVESAKEKPQGAPPSRRSAHGISKEKAFMGPLPKPSAPSSGLAKGSDAVVNTPARAPPSKRSNSTPKAPPVSEVDALGEARRISVCGAPAAEKNTPKTNLMNEADEVGEARRISASEVPARAKATPARSKCANGLGDARRIGSTEAPATEKVTPARSKHEANRCEAVEDAPEEALVLQPAVGKVTPARRRIASTETPAAEKVAPARSKHEDNRRELVEGSREEDSAPQHGLASKAALIFNKPPQTQDLKRVRGSNLAGREKSVEDAKDQYPDIIKDSKEKPRSSSTPQKPVQRDDNLGKKPPRSQKQPSYVIDPPLAVTRPAELPKKQQGKSEQPKADCLPPLNEDVGLDRVQTLPRAASAWADQGVEKKQLDNGSLSNGELIQEVKEVLMEALYGSDLESEQACRTLHEAELAPSSNRTAKTPPSNEEILKEVKDVLMGALYGPSEEFENVCQTLQEAELNVRRKSGGPPARRGRSSGKPSAVPKKVLAALTEKAQQPVSSAAENPDGAMERTRPMPPSTALPLQADDIASRIARLEPRWCGLLLQFLEEAETGTAETVPAVGAAAASRSSSRGASKVAHSEGGPRSSVPSNPSLGKGQRPRGVSPAPAPRKPAVPRS